ncbi:MAG: hypothetical protein AAB071_07655 [Bacteroidota bacterium]
MMENVCILFPQLSKHQLQNGTHYRSTKIHNFRYERGEIEALMDLYGFGQKSETAKEGAIFLKKLQALQMK